MHIDKCPCCEAVELDTDEFICVACFATVDKKLRAKHASKVMVWQQACGINEVIETKRRLDGVREEVVLAAISKKSPAPAALPDHIMTRNTHNVIG